MFQTEFCGNGPHCKLLISWDSENYQSISFDNDIFKDEGVFCKLNDLYQNLSKFSTEFVECMKSVHGPNLEELQTHLHENNPSVTFKIENFNKESYSDELFLLKQQVEKLKQEKEQLIIEHGNEISELQNNFERRTGQLMLEQEEKLNSVKQELEDKYNEEMSDLRKYFENKCTESLRQFTEESYHCSRDSDSDSYSDIEPDDENYEAISSTKYTESNIDHATKNLQKILDKDLKNIRKAYIVEVDKLKEELTKKKEEEIRQLKFALETKYTAKFEQFQTELDRLANGKLLDDSVDYVHSQVKQEYENELERLQNLSDTEFATRFEDDLILKHNEELNKRDEEWRNRVESSISDYMVDSALKNVIKESQQKSQSCHCSPAKKYKYKEIKQLKQKYKQELDDFKLQYENQIQSLVVKYEQEIQKLNEESNMLIGQNKELLEMNENRSKEIDTLKRKIHEYLHRLQDLQENESIERIREELSKMKTHHEIEVSTLKENKYVLEKALDELNEKMRTVENTRYNIISSLVLELKELISKELNGEMVVWPDELKSFHELLRVNETNKKTNEQVEVSMESDRNYVDLNNGMYEDDDLDDILRQRETLRKVILTLYSACESFRRYVSNLDEERNNTLTSELNKIGVVPSKDISTFDDVINSLNQAEKETLKKLHLTANISEMMSLFGDDDSLNITIDGNKSFNQSELSCWFEKLKNDAAAILCLTSGKKVEINDDRLRDVNVQTEVDGRTYEETRHIIEVLQKEISAYEEQYARAQQDIDDLNQEVERLNNKINSLESLEAFGEGVSAVPERVQYDDVASPQKQLTFSRIEEFCAECDKIREEARREREDFESQIEVASKKLKSFEQFLERETMEREIEREESDKKVKLLQDQLKEKERDLNSLNNYSSELHTLEQQLKDLAGDYETTKIRNQTIEFELNAAIDKIWTLRERNQELENKLAQKSELAENCSVELKQRQEEFEHLQQEYQSVRQELDSLQDSGTKQLDMLNEQHEISAALIKQLKSQLLEVEKMVMSRTRELENNYVAVSSSNVASSPSEDISVCDRIADRLRLVSPSGSDVSSSPIHVPVDLLLCLSEKLKKLFRAEDAALKRIQDQDMQINKCSMMIDELQLEKETLQDKLNEVSSKLGEAKFKLDGWQHRSNSAQSEVASKLTKTIETLESQIETHQRIISQKDAKLKEFTRRMEQLESYIKSTETELTDKIEKIEKVNENLKKQLRESTHEIDKLNDLLSGHRREENLSLSAVVEKLLEEKNEQIHELEEKIDVLKSLAEISNKSHSTEIESKGSRRNFTETFESYSDYSDHTRHAVQCDDTISPRYISISSSVKKPLLGSCSNESMCSLQPIQEIDEQIGKPEEPVQKVTFKDDSIQVNLDDSSWIRAPNRESTKIDMDNVDEDTDASELNVDVLREEVKSLKNQLEEEKQNHFSTLIQLRELNSRWEAEKKQMKDAEAVFTSDKATTEKRLKNLKWEHVTCKEQCYKYEQQVLILQKDLDTKKEAVEELKKQLNEIETLKSTVRELEIRSKMEADQLKQKDQRLMELATILEAEKNKAQELNENYEKVFKAVVTERVDAQVKCEEFAHNLKNVTKELEAEKNKSEKLTQVVENMNKKNKEMNALSSNMQNDKDEIDKLKQTIQRLEAEIGQAEKQIRHLEKEKEAMQGANERDNQDKEIISHNSTLKDLTQKVQKEVDLAALLDENMLQSLEFDSKTESFLEELSKLSPIDDELRQILLKILYGGFEVLNVQEKAILQNAYHSFDKVMPNKVVQLQTTVERLSELVKELQIGVETEKKNNKEIKDKSYKLQLEMNRLETVHSYFEERISFLIAKLDEYRNKAVKTEIELTTEKTLRRQVEVSFEHFKRQTREKQTYDSKKLEETIDQLNVTSNENLKLKQESEVLRNKIESLIAELNSVKAITQYHSDSESELSRSLNPLKERLNEMEDKYVRIKHDYEKKKIELRTIKANLHVERTSCKKLESIVKEISSEKHKLEKQLIDKNSRLEDLNWQKQKLEDKLKAAELAEMKRRKMKTTNDAAKKEFECSKELQRKLEKDCQDFQKNIAKLVDELTTMKNNCKQVTQEAQRIFLRMLKAESSQRCLVYQKNYLIITLHEYEQKCDGIVRNITSGVKNFSHFITTRVSMKQKFRSVVFCMISMHRMQFLSNRRIQNNYVKMKNYFLTHAPEITARNDDCFDVLFVKKLHSREPKKDTQDVEEAALQNLCQQFAILRNKYVPDKETIFS